MCCCMHWGVAKMFKPMVGIQVSLLVSLLLYHRDHRLGNLLLHQRDHPLDNLLLHQLDHLLATVRMSSRTPTHFCVTPRWLLYDTMAVRLALSLTMSLLLTSSLRMRQK